MRLSFANFDPATRKSSEQSGGGGRPEAVSFGELLQEQLARQLPVRQDVCIEVAGAYADSQPACTGLGGPGGLHMQDVAAFLELYATGEFVFSPQAIDSALRSPHGEQPVEEWAREGTLSPEEQAGLLRRMLAAGMVSREDVSKANTTVYPRRDGVAGYLHSAPGFTDVRALAEGDYSGRLQAMSENEQLAYHHIKSEYGKSCESILDYAAAHASLHDALQKLTENRGESQ